MRPRAVGEHRQTRERGDNTQVRHGHCTINTYLTIGGVLPVFIDGRLALLFDLTQDARSSGFIVISWVSVANWLASHNQ